MSNKSLLIIGVLLAVTVAATLALAPPADAGKLEEAIAQTPQGTGPGQIDPQAPGWVR